MNKVLSVMAMVLMISVPAMANEGGAKKDPTAAPRINKRIERQKQRISHKLEKGKITQDQANTMNKNVDAVQAKETEMAKDGKLTKQERKELRQDLKKNGEEIKSTGEKAPTTGN